MHAIILSLRAGAQEECSTQATRHAVVELQPCKRMRMDPYQKACVHVRLYAHPAVGPESGAVLSTMTISMRPPRKIPPFRLQTEAPGWCGVRKQRGGSEATTVNRAPCGAECRQRDTRRDAPVRSGWPLRAIVGSKPRNRGRPVGTGQDRHRGSGADGSSSARPARPRLYLDLPP